MIFLFLNQNICYGYLTYAKYYGEENINNFMLKIVVYLNLYIRENIASIEEYL